MQQLRFSQMIKDITEESEVWITKDNLNQKINTNLFEETKATTGLVTRSSEHWKYFASAYEYEGHPNVVRFGEFDEHNIRDPKSIFSSPDDAPPDRSVRFLAFDYLQNLTLLRMYLPQEHYD